VKLQTLAQFSRSRSVLPLVTVLFFFSGASSLVFETIFTRLLTYTFGNTAHAVSTVLAAFLGGLALGAFLLGRWVDRHGASLWSYGVLELAVGIYCVFIPQFFALLTRVYVALYHLLHLGSWSLVVLRFGLAALVILLPTLLMGGTLPVLARCVAAARREFQPEVDRLYAWNTLGAATGTLASTYLLMPSLGVRGTIGMACGVNFAIFLVVAAWASRFPITLAHEVASPAAPAALHAKAPSGMGFEKLLLLAAFLTGVVALAYEVVWTHVLSFLIGNTVYAFGLMLFTFLCGLGWGAHLVARHLRGPSVWARALVASQLFLGLAVFGSFRLWNYVPHLFAQGLARALEFDLLSFAFLLVLRMGYVGWRIYHRPSEVQLPWSKLVEFVVEVLLLWGLLSPKTFLLLWKYETTPFVAGELLRFFCAFYLLIVPCLLLGLSFPLLLNLSTEAARRVGSSVGRVYAANTVGTVLGSVLTGFMVLPVLGSYETLRAAATLNLILGLGLALFLVRLSRARKLVLALVAASWAILFWRGPGNWDARSMTRGTYVYFNAGWPIDQVLYFQEDVQGGLTSVVQVGSSRVLLSNGKFQGNNTGEVGDQARLAMIPILFTRGFEKALVIGLGTGHTLRVVGRFPFQQIDTVELAPHIVNAARRWFEDVNDGIFDRAPRVRLSIADGRNFLLLARQRYDLITIEVSSIWISGEADLYNREFYELCRSRLTEQGVLQQWVQIHHMRTKDLLVILNTAAQVLPHVAFFLGPEQGLLIASSSPLECDYRHIEAFDSEPGVQKELATLGVPNLWSLLGELRLYDNTFREALAFLPRLSNLPQDFASTDNRPYLEYQTPKGNTLLDDTVGPNRQFLERFRPRGLPANLVVRNLPSENERHLLLGYVAEAQGDLLSALDYFRRVQGPAKARAGVGISRIESRIRTATP